MLIFIPLGTEVTEMEKYPNINRKFNSFEINSGKGNKKEGDYIIFVNGKQVKDEDTFELLCTEIISEKDAIKFLYFLWEIGEIEKQEDEPLVFDSINVRDFNDKIKTFLYVVWHRLIIDDINYPLPRFNGRQRLLGQIYILLAKKFNFELPNEIKSIPEEVYRLGFPEGIEEKIKTETWSEIYILYKKFVNLSKNLMGDDC